MNNLIYDELLCFGEISIPQGMNEPSFPHSLNMGREPGSKDSYPGEEFTNADLRTVDVLFNSVSGPGNARATVTVKGNSVTGNDGSGQWNTIATNYFTLEQMQRGPCRVAISPNEYQYLRVYIKTDYGPTGFAKCYLNTYAGK